MDDKPRNIGIVKAWSKMTPDEKIELSQRLLWSLNPKNPLNHGPFSTKHPGPMHADELMLLHRIFMDS